ncbi:MAG: M6 family metalloprotease domain-containing protein [Bacteroides sp.]|nr:M6 family metalloprotease domain-containing protein [Bacteroides sp.]
MNFKSLLPLLALGLPLISLARPAVPTPIESRNPDGSVQIIRLFGDEGFSYTTDEGCTRILERDARGFWQPAMRNGRLLIPNSADIELLRAEMPDKVELMPQHAARAAGAQRMASIDNMGQTLFPTIGEEIHSPVVLIEFADKPYTVSTASFENMLNGENYTEYGGHGSVKKYYSDCSQGKFNITFDLYGPVKVSQTSEYYVAAGSSLPSAGKYGRFGEALYEALNKLKADGADFSKYDYDDDGIIDSIYFFYSGYGQADTGDPTTIWPHQSNLIYFTYDYFLNLDPITFGDKQLGPYACSNELNGYTVPGVVGPALDGIGAFCHEFGHVIGLPDFYDAQAQAGQSTIKTKTPGRWSVMDSGTYNDFGTCPPIFSSYEQWVCRWLEMDEPEVGTHVELRPLVDDDRNAAWLRVRRNTAAVQYAPTSFYIENRAPKGWDEYLPDSGLLVWRVKFDKSRWTSNRVNTGGVSNVEVLGADEAADQWTYPGKKNNYTYIIPSSSGALLPGINTPYFNCFITSIEVDPETYNVSFDYNVYNEQPTDVTVLHDDPKRDATKRNFLLKWDKVEDAEYILTLKRFDSSGREIIVNGYNETEIGNKTSILISNLSSAAFKQRFEAYVRVKKGIPSSEISNVLSFVPENLEKVENLQEEDGTDSISEIGQDSDFFAYGLNGCIEASEGARVYNLNGIETGKENLPAGIYLVRLGQQVRKVVVR